MGKYSGDPFKGVGHVGRTNGERNIKNNRKQNAYGENMPNELSLAWFIYINLCKRHKLQHLFLDKQ